MIITPKTGYQPTQRQRKSLFPFQYGLRSQEFKGIGANKADNTWFRDGRLKKMLGSELFKTITADSIVFMGEYQKDNGAYQLIVCYEDTGVYKFRAIEEDATVTTPGTESITTKTGTVTATLDSLTITGSGTAFTTEFSVGDWIVVDPGDGVYYKISNITSDTVLTLATAYGGTTISGSNIKLVEYPNGAGDVSFTSDEFSFEQVLDNGFIGNNTALNQLYRWDGGGLAAVASAPQFIRGLARDGKRLAAITREKAEFSVDAPSLTFRGGDGVSVSGEYSTSIRSPRAILTAGMGVVIIGETGSEAHKVVPNNASDDVSADTKIDGYNDNEHGVTLQKQAVMGKSFIWRTTPEGIMRTNPFNGETVNVTDIGKARRYWDNWSHDNDAIAYDETNEQVVCATSDGAQNDILACIDTTKEDLPMSVKTDSYYASLTSVNNQLYGGGSRDGSIDKLFTTTSNSESKNFTMKYISEWDELTNQMYGKVFKRLVIAANLSPDSSMEVKIYFDGSTTPTYSETFTTNDTTETSVLDAPYGMFVFGGSISGVETSNSDEIGESRKTKKFSTVAIEISENSSDPFEVHDIILEYKTKNKFYHQLTRANTLFS